MYYSGLKATGLRMRTTGRTLSWLLSEKHCVGMVLILIIVLTYLLFSDY